MRLLLWPERERAVIELYKKGISPKEIAHQLKMSLRDVYKIIHEHFGRNKKELSNELKAVLLYRKGKMPVDAALKLSIPLEEASRYYMRYYDSYYLGRFGAAYKMMRGYLKEVSEICDAMQRKEIAIYEIVRGFHLADCLPEMESQYSDFSMVIEGMKQEIDNLTLQKGEVNKQLNGVNNSLAQATACLAGLNSQVRVANDNLTRAMAAYQNYDSLFNTNNPGYNFSGLSNIPYGRF